MEKTVMTDSIVDRIVSFITGHFFRRNALMKVGTFEFYVRRTTRVLQSNSYPVLDLARIENTNPGHGAFKTILAELEKRLPAECNTLAIYVECVHNERLGAFLVKQGYTATNLGYAGTVDMSYFKILDLPTNPGAVQ